MSSTLFTSFHVKKHFSRAIAALLAAVFVLTSLFIPQDAAEVQAATVTGRVLNVPWVHQVNGLWDPSTNSWTHSEWSGLLFEDGRATMASGGCGFACAAGAISYALGRQINPQEIMTFACGYNGIAGDVDLGVRSAAQYGIRAEVLGSPSKQTVANLLLAGNPVMVLENGGSRFGSGRSAHFILLIGYTGGRFAALDPNDFAQGHANSWYSDRTTLSWEDINNGAWHSSGGAYSVFYAGNQQVKSGSDYYLKDCFGKTLTGFHEIPEQNKICYYDKSTGKMVYGKKKIGKYWYYFDEKSGAMLTNGFHYFADKKKTCYYDSKGHCVYGLRKIKGKYYYFNKKTGARATNTFKTISKGRRVYFNKKGKMVFGLKKIKGFYYYFDKKTGAMKKNTFVKVSGKRTCYFDKKGHMVFGRKKIKGVWYTFNRITGAVKKR